MEIERKFLIHTPPADLASYPSQLLEQAYLCTEPVVRIRRSDDTYTLTYKSKGLMSREEYNLPDLQIQGTYEPGGIQPASDGRKL